MKLPIQNVKLPVRLIYDPPLTDDELLELSAGNDVVWIEREASGALYAKPIMDTINGARSSHLSGRLHMWAEKDGRGDRFGRAGFLLADGSMRGASCASWVLEERMAALTEEQREKYAPLAPDFVVELLSSMDDPDYLRAKMDQWIANGVQVAWLIEPEDRRVTIYRAGEKPEVFEGPDRIVGSGVISGFEIEMTRVWDDLPAQTDSDDLCDVNRLPRPHGDDQFHSGRKGRGQVHDKTEAVGDCETVSDNRRSEL